MEIISLSLRPHRDAKLWLWSCLNHRLDLQDSHWIWENGDFGLLHHELLLVLLLFAIGTSMARFDDAVAWSRKEVATDRNGFGEAQYECSHSTNSFRYSNSISDWTHFVYRKFRRHRARLSQNQKHHGSLLRSQLSASLHLRQILAHDRNLRKVHSCNVNIRVELRRFIHHDDIVRFISKVEADQRENVRGQGKGKSYATKKVFGKSGLRNKKWKLISLVLLMLIFQKNLNSQFKLPEYWKEHRMYYRSVCDLVAFVDEKIDYITILSISNNLFFICVQLLNSME